MPQVPTEHVWTFHVRDRTGQRIAAINDYAKVKLVQRYNAVGAWVIEGVPMTSRAASVLVPGAGIEALRDGELVLSGPMLKPTLAWSSAGYTLTASGVDDNLLLAGRLCYPAAPSINPNSAYADVRTGVASTVMAAYVNNNLGPLADSTRRQDVGMGADPATGLAVSYSARFDRLLDVLFQLGLPEVAGGLGLGFRIAAVDPDVYGYSRQFQMYTPNNLVTTVQFSATRGNLQSYTYDREMAALNYVLVGGGGDGTLRVFQADQNADSIAEWGLRLEGFKDQRQTSVLADLVQAAADELAVKGDQASLELQPEDTDAMAWGTDWVLGDQVRVLIDGAPVDDVVREVTIELAGTEPEVVTPTVGTPGAVAAGSSADAALGLLFTRQADLARRLGRLERAK